MKIWLYNFQPGPGFWGLINPQWSMCNKGRRQSPVNVEPDKLLFDPWLRDIQFDKHKVSYIVSLLRAKPVETMRSATRTLAPTPTIQGVFKLKKNSKTGVNIS